jgi:hypothetical protein
VDGVSALGGTRAEVEEWMAARLEMGVPVPEPHTDAGRVAA